jgi:hypothetical protein
MAKAKDIRNRRILLYSHGEARVVISIAGRRHTVPDPGANGLLRVVDQTALLARDDAPYL